MIPSFLPILQNAPPLEQPDAAASNQMQQRHQRFYPLPFCRPSPNTRRQISVSQTSAFKSFCISFQHAANPVRIISELFHGCL